ncbi:MAG: GNAT family N-acetyltransferase [Alphaproteobacteria bacterium]|nr:GNAT family N-acetyltransferase [Alphaproteobacteria bacterium]
MSNYKIVFPDKKHKKELFNIAKEFKENPTSFDINHMDKIVEAYEKNDLEMYLKKCEESRKGINLPEGHVPSFNLWIVKDDKIIAIADIRPTLNDYLRNVQGGHLAYEMVPSYRGKGLMNTIGKMLLQYMYEHFEIKEALITCREANTPSYKVISRLMNEMGGHQDTDTIIDGETEKRFWVNTLK